MSDIAAHVLESGSYGAPLDTPMGTDCAVHSHREWVPLNVHHIWPRGLGGPDTPDNKVSLCMNAHGSVHEVIRRLIKGNGDLADAEHFSSRVKKLAVQGWTLAGKPVHGSGGE